MPSHWSYRVPARYTTSSGYRDTYAYSYRAVLQAVEARYDVHGSVLAEMIRACPTDRAALPVSRRVYCAEHAIPEAIRYLEQLTARLLFGANGRFSPEEYRYLRTSSDGFPA